MKKSRIFYLCLALATMLIGLISRSELIPLNDFILNYAGDTLWALMVYWLIRAVFPNIHVRAVFVMAVIFSFGIEFSQIYHAPWIDAIRANKFGRLVFGVGFKSSDLVCYLLGILFGVYVDLVCVSKFTDRASIAR